MHVEAIASSSDFGLATLDRTFLVESRLVLQMRDGALTYDVAAVDAPYWKTYPSPAASEHGREGFIAREGSAILGRLAMSSHWTGLIANQRSCRLQQRTAPGCR